jgi:hypothetical protein
MFWLNTVLFLEESIMTFGAIHSLASYLSRGDGDDRGDGDRL